MPVVTDLAEAEKDLEEVAVGFLLGAGVIMGIVIVSSTRVGRGGIGRGFVFPQKTLRFCLQSLVFLSFVVEEVDAVDIFIHLRETEIYKFHIFATAETDGAHESLEEQNSVFLTLVQRSDEDAVEDIESFEAACHFEETD